MATQKLRTVRLYGHLGARFGRTHQFSVASAAEAIRALCSQFEGFREAISKVNVAVRIGSRVINEADVRAGRLSEPVGNDDIRIAPVPIGSGKNGILQTVLGVVLIVVGAYTSNPALIGAGASLVVGGVIQMLTPTPSLDRDRDGPNNRPSYNFNGPVNTSAQGNPVPVLYGRMMVGSYVVSGGIYNEESI